MSSNVSVADIYFPINILT